MPDQGVVIEMPFHVMSPVTNYPRERFQLSFIREERLKS